MSSQHPDLTTALADLNTDNGWGPLIRIGLNARAAADEGRYCECHEPLLTDPDLMCGACLLNNRGQEIAAVKRIVGAHEFEPSSKLGGQFCSICMLPADAPRHRGVHAVGRTSWGSEVRP